MTPRFGGSIRRRLVSILLMTLGAGLLSVNPGLAHDLADNRASLVLRESRHLSLTLHVRFTEMAWRALARDQGYGAFLTMCASLDEAAFADLVSRAVVRIESETRLAVNGTSAVVLQRWQWPESARLQSLVRQQVMEAIVAGSAHVHEPQIEVRADLVAQGPVREARLEPAVALGRLLLVWYRPVQAWVTPGQVLPVARF
jgi:hypothetical protein